MLSTSRQIADPDRPSAEQRTLVGSFSSSRSDAVVRLFTNRLQSPPYSLGATE